MTSGTGLGGNLTVTFEVTDGDADFIYVRFRTASSGGSWSKATIISQIVFVERRQGAALVAEPPSPCVRWRETAEVYAARVPVWMTAMAAGFPFG